MLGRLAGSVAPRYISIEKKNENPPNAANILAYLGGIRALELVKLSVPLDLEEHFLSRLCYDLNIA